MILGGEFCNLLCGPQVSNRTVRPSANCRGGHPACRRAEASCPADHVVRTRTQPPRFKRCSGRQDARPLRQAGCPPLPTTSGCTAAGTDTRVNRANAHPLDVKAPHFATDATLRQWRRGVRSHVDRGGHWQLRARQRTARTTYSSRESPTSRQALQR